MGVAPRPTPVPAPPSNLAPVKNQLNPASCTTGFTPSPGMFDSEALNASYTCTDNYGKSGGCDGGLQADWEGPRAHSYVANGQVLWIYFCWSGDTGYYGQSWLKCGNQPAFSPVAATGGFECRSAPLTCSAPLIASATKAQSNPEFFYYTCAHTFRRN